MQKYTEPARRKSTWRYGIGVVASLLLLALSSCGFDGQTSASNSTQAQPPLSKCDNSTKGAAKPTEFYSINMVNESAGWGTKYGTTQEQNGSVSSNGLSNLLRTSDGGCTWQGIREWKQGGGFFTPYFISDKTAWIVFPTALEYTNDAGKTWQATKLPLAKNETADVRHVTFLNENTGWIVAGVYKQDAYKQMPNSAIFATKDGGKTWTQIFRADAETVKKDPKQPYIIHTVQFQNEQTGWLVSTLNQAEAVTPQHGLFSTNDGGKTWQALQLPVPQGLKSLSGLNLSTPTFFSAQEGILPASINESTENKNGFFNYVTHDGGKTWQAQPYYKFDYNTDVPQQEGTVRPAIYILTQAPRFVSMNTGWNGSNPDLMFYTSNGGQSWQKTKLTLPENTHAQFVTDRVGYALGRDSKGKSPVSHVYRTTDGGKTWAEVAYKAEG